MVQIKQALVLTAGAVADVALPHLGRDMDAGRNKAQAARLKRAILKSRMRRAQLSKDSDGVQVALSAFWRGAAGDKFHVDYGRASFQHFVENHGRAIGALDECVKASGLDFSRLVEVGCGDGKALAYCAGKLCWVEQGVGIDINAGAVERATAAQPTGSPLQFVCSDAEAWLLANPQAGTVMVSNGGVLEYFSQDGVDRLLAALTLARPAAVLLLEPLDYEHDLTKRRDSYIFRSTGALGQETTFSHNHRARLEQAGFTVTFAEETSFDHTRGVIMLAVLK